MSAKSAYQTDLTKSRELIAVAERLTQEYAELRELSRDLRNESRQLSDDSYVLRRIGTALMCRESL
jgi:hypothetical protein